MITPVIEEIENESSDSFTPEITLGQITQDVESEAIENSPETTSFEHYWNDCNNVPTNEKIGISLLHLIVLYPTSIWIITHIRNKQIVSSLPIQC